MKKFLLLFVVAIGATFSTTAQDSIPLKNNQEIKVNNKIQGYTYLGADFKHNAVGPSIDLTLGARLSKYLYIGGGIGWHNSIGKYYMKGEIYSIPYNYWLTSWGNSANITFDLKAYIATKIDFYPRFDFSFGPCLAGLFYITDNSITNTTVTIKHHTGYNFGYGLYASMGVGFDWQRFSFGLGCQMFAIAGANVMPYGNVRIGVRFGK